jgi:DUF1365 family protein
MTPALCTGRVLHARFAQELGEHANPARNAFIYPLFFVTLPLSGEVSAGRWFGLNRWAPLSLFHRDHGARDGSPLLPWIQQLLSREGITSADGEIVLQTFPRVFGMVFNPVSFWLCHDAAGYLRAVLAEVRNTFGERHNYLVAHADERPIAANDTILARKVFHVSPFYPVDGEYRFCFNLTSERRRVDIDYFRNGQRVLLTTLEGVVSPLDEANARGAALRFPLLAVGVVWRIHWQALRLWFKGAFFFRKPPLPNQETTR